MSNFVAIGEIILRLATVLCDTSLEDHLIHCVQTVDVQVSMVWGMS